MDIISKVTIFFKYTPSSLRPQPPEVTIAAYYETRFGRPLAFPHLPALDCTPKREAKQVFVSGICRGMFRPGSPEGPETFLRWLASRHNLTPTSCKVRVHVQRQMLTHRLQSSGDPTDPYIESARRSN